jgi:hypothetical protein
MITARSNNSKITVSFIVTLSTADVGFMYDESAVLEETIKKTLAFLTF